MTTAGATPTIAMVPPVVVDARCTACGACIGTCPEHALVPAPHRPEVLHLRCTACLACVEVCPVDAISESHDRLGACP